MTIRTTPLLLAALVALTACGDSNGPGNFSPMATSQKVGQAFGAVDNNKAVRSMNVLAHAFTLTAAPPVLPDPAPAAPVHVTGLDASLLGVGRALEHAAARFATSNPAALFPANAVGKTFIYSSQTAKYQASDQSGAPTAGVRYLLYAVDPTNTVVMTPLQQVGILDLSDKSSNAANTLGIKAAINDLTVLEYDASGSVATSSFTFGAKGYVVDGANRLDFDLSQSVSVAGDLKIDYKITAPNQGNVSIRLEANGTYGGTSTATLTITEGSDKMEIVATGTDASRTGTVKYNGKTLANISVTGKNDPVFTGASGRVLTADDASGLKQLFDLADTLLARFDDLLVPAYFVFGLPT